MIKKQDKRENAAPGWGLLLALRGGTRCLTLDRRLGEGRQAAGVKHSVHCGTVFQEQQWSIAGLSLEPSKVHICYDP